MELPAVRLGQGGLAVGALSACRYHHSNDERTGRLSAADRTSIYADAAAAGPGRPAAFPLAAPAWVAGHALRRAFPP